MIAFPLVRRSALAAARAETDRLSAKLTAQTRARAEAERSRDRARADVSRLGYAADAARESQAEVRRLSAELAKARRVADDVAYQEREIARLWERVDAACSAQDRAEQAAEEARTDAADAREQLRRIRAFFAQVDARLKEPLPTPGDQVVVEPVLDAVLRVEVVRQALHVAAEHDPDHRPVYEQLRDQITARTNTAIREAGGDYIAAERRLREAMSLHPSADLPTPVPAETTTGGTR
jgi:chromosome segregation ATPase